MTKTRFAFLSLGLTGVLALSPACALFSSAPATVASVNQTVYNSIQDALTALNDAGTVATQILNAVAAAHTAGLVPDAAYQAFSDGFRALEAQVDKIDQDSQVATATTTSVAAEIQAFLTQVNQWLATVTITTSDPAIAANAKTLNTKITAIHSKLGGK